MICSKIISGGQTGVDRGALDACLQNDFPCGGWCPAGRLAEDGEIPEQYPLQETWNSNYDERTRLNVRDSDATVIIYEHKLKGGTQLTYQTAQEKEKPVFLFKMSPFLIDELLEQLYHFLKINEVETLNVAGPRESQWTGAYEQSLLIISKLIHKIRTPI